MCADSVQQSAPSPKAGDASGLGALPVGSGSMERIEITQEKALSSL